MVSRASFVEEIEATSIIVVAEIITEIMNEVLEIAGSSVKDKENALKVKEENIDIPDKNSPKESKPTDEEQEVAKEPDEQEEKAEEITLAIEEQAEGRDTNIPVDEEQQEEEEEGTANMSDPPSRSAGGGHPPEAVSASRNPDPGDPGAADSCIQWLSARRPTATSQSGMNKSVCKTSAEMIRLANPIFRQVYRDSSALF